MTRFLVLYRSSIPAREQLAGATPEQTKAGMEAWSAWARDNAGAIVELGAPLGEGRRVSPDAQARGDSGVSGYSIVEADSEVEAVELFRDHPHLRMPGESSIEVLEFLPMPGA